MVVTVNGERREVSGPTVASLLEELGYAGSFMAVAINQEVVRRASWADTDVRDGDHVEVLTPRQGG